MKMQKNVGFLSDALLSMGYGVIVCDREGNVVSLNAMAESLTGWPAARAAGCPVSEVFRIVDPDTRAPVDDPVARVMRGEAVRELSGRRVLVSREGRESRISSSCAAVCEGEGDITGTVLMFSDATEEYERQKEVQENERFLRTAIDALSHPFAVIDPESYRIEMANQAYGGWAVVGKTCYAVSHHRESPCSGKDHVCPVDAVRRTLHPATMRHTHYDARGMARQIEIHAHPVIDEQGRLVRVVEHSLDITGRQMADEQLRRSETRLKSLVKILEDPSDTVQEFLDHALHEVVHLTESKIGYIYFYDEDRRQFVLNTWSKDVMQECSVADPKTVYDLDRTGIWGEAVRQRRPILVNDFQAENPLKRGYPPGHVHIEKFLTIPIFRGDQIIAVVGVANKAADYDESDAMQLKLLMDAVWKSIDVKLAEEALRESEEKYRLLVDHSSDLIWSLTPEGVFTYASPSWLKITGRDPVEVIGKSFRSFVHPEDIQICAEYLSQVVEGKTSLPHPEYRVRHADGSWHWHSAAGSLVKDENGAFKSFVGVSRDITERKNVEQALLESEERFNKLAEQSRTVTWEVDAEGLYTFLSPLAENILGYKPEELVGRKYFYDICLPADQEKVKEFGLRVMRRRESLTNFENRLVTRDGRPFWVMRSGMTLVGAEGEVLGFRGSDTDIDERMQYERKLLKANRQFEEATARANEMAMHAETANRAKSEFLANMSHEIRTPLNGIIGMTGLLLDTELTADQQRYAEVVRESGESLLTLINDILDFSKIEANKLDLEEVDFNLVGLLDDLTANLAVRAHEKGLELLCSWEEQVPKMLRGDPGRLRQIITNLAGNAIKFTARGEVSIRVSVTSESDEEATLCFTVRDTGIGIPENKLELIFQKFSQVDASTTRLYGGSGLGLAIAKQLVEMMGGRMGVNSREGKGSEFWFTVDLRKQPEQGEQEPPVYSDLRGVRVLVVDDNTTGREILTGRLTSWGMRPEESKDGPAAIEALLQAKEEGDPFRLAVIDMQMPGLDGETLGRMILADERLADTRLVMLTSLGSRGDARRFAKAGFAAYLTKPVRNEELQVALSLSLMERLGAFVKHRPITTRHSAREALMIFADRPVRILLAEDNATNRQVALGILKKLGLKADAVANGAEAIEALEQVVYDLVLMDVQMPVMDGLEATRAIRSSRNLSGPNTVPIIAMTAHAMAGDRERCLAAGMNDYVAKPVGHLALAEVLEKWLADDASRRAKTHPGEGAKETEKPSPSEMSVWDRSGLLDRLMGDHDLMEEIAEAFLLDIPQQIQRLGTFLESRDGPGAERWAHTIKGAAASVGAEAIRHEAMEIEKSVGRGDVDAARSRLAVLEDRLRETKAVMEAFLSER